MKAIINTDGGARGNPGPAAIGIVVRDSSNKIVKEIAKSIGNGTNNEAEYTALIEGLKTAKELFYKELDFYLDSELVVKQLNGSYKVKNDRIKALWLKAKELEKNFEKITYTHIRREENKRADALVNEALDSLKA